MKKLNYDNLYPPEFYHEIPNFDSRIAIRKFLDALDTISMAAISLSYIDDNPCTDFEKNFVKTIHLRHAIVDLNNSFDLLLQIPWMFYRAWSAFNTGGSLRSYSCYNKHDIVRNTDDWVNSAEKECSAKKLMKFLNYINNPLEQKFNNFTNTYINKGLNKTFTVRTLCNTMKHNHALSFTELYKPYVFNINFQNKQVNLRDENVKICFDCKFFEQSNPETPIGVIKANYSKDLEIDIEYFNGDVFRYSDCTHQSDRYDIIQVLNECIDYYDATVDLFENIYNVIYPEIPFCPVLATNGKPNIKIEKDNINLNKYFSET